MLSKLVAIAALLTIAGCGHATNKSKLKRILSSNGPQWEVITTNSQHRYSPNIMALFYRGKIRGSGFIPASGLRLLITNAHVALPWKEMCRIKCPKFIGINTDNAIEITGFYKTEQFTGTDRDFDLAIFKFKWIEKKRDIEDMTFAPRAPLIGEHIHLIGFTYFESDFVISRGVVTGENLYATYKPSFHYNADTENLNSGSPVFNIYDQLVGIHFGSPVKNGFNRAVSIPLIKMTYPELF